MNHEVLQVSQQAQTCLEPFFLSNEKLDRLGRASRISNTNNNNNINSNTAVEQTPPSTSTTIKIAVAGQVHHSATPYQMRGIIAILCPTVCIHRVDFGTKSRGGAAGSHHGGTERTGCAFIEVKVPTAANSSEKEAPQPAALEELYSTRAHRRVRFVPGGVMVYPETQDNESTEAEKERLRRFADPATRGLPGLLDGYPIHRMTLQPKASKQHQQQQQQQQHGAVNINKTPSPSSSLHQKQQPPRYYQNSGKQQHHKYEYQQEQQSQKEAEQEHYEQVLEEQNYDHMQEIHKRQHSSFYQYNKNHNNRNGSSCFEHHVRQYEFDTYRPEKPKHQLQQQQKFSSGLHSNNNSNSAEAAATAATAAHPVVYNNKKQRPPQQHSYSPSYASSNMNSAHHSYKQNFYNNSNAYHQNKYNHQNVAGKSHGASSAVPPPPSYRHQQPSNTAAPVGKPMSTAATGVPPPPPPPPAYESAHFLTKPAAQKASSVPPAEAVRASSTASDSQSASGSECGQGNDESSGSSHSHSRRLSDDFDRTGGAACDDDDEVGSQSEEPVLSVLAIDTRPAAFLAAQQGRQQKEHDAMLPHGASSSVFLGSGGSASGSGAFAIDDASVWDSAAIVKSDAAGATTTVNSASSSGAAVLPFLNMNWSGSDENHTKAVGPAAAAAAAATSSTDATNAAVSAGDDDDFAQYQLKLHNIFSSTALFTLGDE